MLGYWNKKDETNEVIKEGWLHTGDIGEFTKEGNLKITDRKKEIIVNLGGDNISPSKIENLLCLNEKIKQSLVYGDKKTYLVALIVTDNEKNRSEINNVSIKSIENEYKKNIPAERFALPNEVASAVCFLCSNEASYINGINLPIDGGYSVM